MNGILLHTNFTTECAAAYLEFCAKPVREKWSKLSGTGKAYYVALANGHLAGMLGCPVSMRELELSPQCLWMAASLLVLLLKGRRPDDRYKGALLTGEMSPDVPLYYVGRFPMDYSQWPFGGLSGCTEKGIEGGGGGGGGLPEPSQVAPVAEARCTEEEGTEVREILETSFL